VLLLLVLAAVVGLDVIVLSLLLIADRWEVLVMVEARHQTLVWLILQAIAGYGSRIYRLLASSVVLA